MLWNAMREAKRDSFSGFSLGNPRRLWRKITQIEKKKVYQQSPDTEAGTFSMESFSRLIRPQVCVKKLVFRAKKVCRNESALERTGSGRLHLNKNDIRDPTCFSAFVTSDYSSLTLEVSVKLQANRAVMLTRRPIHHLWVFCSSKPMMTMKLCQSTRCKIPVVH
jgi:hypothetical protein